MDYMEFSSYFPVWDRLTDAQRDLIRRTISHQTVKKGTVIHNGSADCAGTCFIGYGERRNFLKFKSVCFGSEDRYHCDDEHHCKK